MKPTTTIISISFHAAVNNTLGYQASYPDSDDNATVKDNFFECAKISIYILIRERSEDTKG